MEKVLEIIRADVSEDKMHVDNPTQNLESYFPRRGGEGARAIGRNLRRDGRREGGGVFER